MSNILVSIIIPCYNVEKYIEECVDSAFSQVYPNIEVICIDNNSTDSTVEIINKLRTKHTNLILDFELKPGAPAARNKGLKIAKGKWIQFLDADDLILPNKISNQIKILNEQPEVCFIAGFYIKRKLIGDDRKHSFPTTFSFMALLNSQLGITSSNLFNKIYLDEVGGWFENQQSSQEAKLIFELVKVNANILFDPQRLTIIREREKGQISQQNPKEVWLRYIQLRIEMIEYIKQYEKDFYNENKDGIWKIIFDHLRVMAKYDLTISNKLYVENFPSDYLPKSKKDKMTLYGFVFKLIGFKKTEQLFQLLIKN